MKLKSGFFIFLLLSIWLTSCVSSKKVPYFQMKNQKQKEVTLATHTKENTVRFQPDDVLSITVNVPGHKGQSVAYDYNLPLQPSPTDGSALEVHQVTTRQTYLVDKEGHINFPVLGSVQVSGYTITELENHFKDLLRSRHLKFEPIVTVRLMNFRLTVTGEVNRPGPISVSQDHISIVEALAYAGDMTIYGKRDEVLLVREMPDGFVKKVTLDISKADIISSPYYYLHQNDMIYVPPNKTRSYVADVNPQLGTILSVGSFLVSLVSFVMLITQ
jgi:polysaccharide export outer membrane protein